MDLDLYIGHTLRIIEDEDAFYITYHDNNEDSEEVTFARMFRKDSTTCLQSLVWELCNMLDATKAGIEI